MCMVEGEDNPELIEKILVMHGKQQQKQQEDLDDAAVYRICGDIRMRFPFSEKGVIITSC